MYAEPFAPHTLASLGWRELNATLTRVRRTVQVTDGVRLSDGDRDHITACKISAPGNMSIRDGNISRLQMNDAMILLGQRALHNYLIMSVWPTCQLKSEQCRRPFLGAPAPCLGVPGLTLNGSINVGGAGGAPIAGLDCPGDPTFQFDNGSMQGKVGDGNHKASNPNEKCKVLPGTTLQNACQHI